MTSGIYDALDLRDGGSDYRGKGVLKVSSTSHGVIWYASVWMYNVFLLFKFKL
jgi:enolase